MVPVISCKCRTVTKLSNSQESPLGQIRNLGPVHMLGIRAACLASSRDRIVVSTLRCGRSNPGSNPGHGSTARQGFF